MKKKLRVYYMCSILAEIQYIPVETPVEGRLLIYTLENIVGKIIHEHGITPTGGFGIGLEVEDDTMEGGWADWMCRMGNNINDYNIVDLRKQQDAGFPVVPAGATGTMRDPD